MANMVIASSKTHLPISSSLSAHRPKSPIIQSSPVIPKIQTLNSAKLQLPSLSLKHLSLIGAAAAPLLMAPLPALAEEVEKASLFDFNLTLPIIMGEFLLLMFALDKVYFSPLGNFMDQRDAAIKEKLGSVSDTSAEVKQLEEQAKAVMRAARAEIAAALNKMKKETQEDLEAKIKEKSKIVEAELQEALANLERQKEETIKALDSQIAALSEEIVKKVLPTQ
jgi:F-type H+-transporting ATPase subunit b